MLGYKALRGWFDGGIKYEEDEQRWARDTYPHGQQLAEHGAQTVSMGAGVQCPDQGKVLVWTHVS